MSYPYSFCDAKRYEFMSLVHGPMIVDEYEKKFNELAKYALAFVVDEVDKCTQFEDGLLIEIIASVMVSSNWLDFSKLVEATMRIKRCLAEVESAKGERRCGGQSGQ